jgi:asparagine synthase (glutamine-hydrolysing)
MCGIAGYWDLDARAKVEELLTIATAMADALSLRGPDDSGAWVDERAGIALSHRRLSILDLSPLGHQPMVSACGRYVITFNGEIYNFHELRSDLIVRGQTFRSRSDTEVLLAAIAVWGLEVALSRADGMFALALWDTITQRLYLCRDRFGEKPLYYGFVGRTLLFGSELKALWKHPSFNPRIDCQAVADFFASGYVSCPRAIFEGVHQVKPATIVTVSRHGVQECAFWDIGATITRALDATPIKSENAAIEELDSLLLASVRSRSISDVPVGLFLSGGIDSGLVAAAMQRVSSSPVCSFTVGLADEKLSEAEDAGWVARKLGTKHETIWLEPDDLLRLMPRFCEMYDEPFADVAALPTYLIAKQARKTVTVALTGDGGDELFGGYKTILNARRYFSKIVKLSSPLKNAIAFLLSLLQNSRTANGGEPRSLWQARFRLLALASAPHPWPSLYDAVYRNEQSARFFTPGFRARLLSAEVRASDVPQRVHSAEDAFMFYCQSTTLPDKHFCKVDRATMASGLEARLPFINPAMFEFSWRIRRSLLFSGGLGKAFARKLLARHLGPEYAALPKRGFDVPLSAWLASPLRDWVESLVSEQRISQEGWLDYRRIVQLRNRFAVHPRQARNELWNVLVFQSWIAQVGRLRSARN